MLNYKKILVPFDGSDHAVEALKMAVKIAESCEDAELVLATVVKPGTLQIDQTNITDPAKEPVIVSEKLRAAKDALPEGLKSETLELEGQPGDVLIKLADEKGADLIVMGSRGIGAFKGMFMGSVSSFVVSQSKCPVMIVK